MNNRKPLQTLRRQRGAAAAEYAVTVIYWVALTFAAIEMGRVMYMITATYEATRIGARYAIVCSLDEAAVKTRMTNFLPILQNSNISVSYAGGTCTTTSCDSTDVRITNVPFSTIIPLIPMSFTLPPASTSMYPETRRAQSDPVCS